ncbi:uncharacterized protein B0J16DRAFT_330270 [Fusarium flagelliforme]|uniref:Uncharacterized protein n=1 Tax=Fusarium flagelliforme TaxID=2675880 RepID=A0A395N5U2_9HYPO|nr:uncharacterized protein B0J16DRAFT_330270 [Fusarium flagelliforme]KAH7198342.1 hypothetical protein B0J16DRAFT_330270 [Fusarium flagelliforme]RFN55257.1 hypothetical protein FIE12Z_510 [Fusarium flagelliforme]
MRTQFFLSLAVGVVAASPCKPLTSAVTTVPETSLTTEVIESTAIETSAAIETSVTETFTSTIVDTTGSDAVSTTLTTSSAETTTLLTTETSAEITGATTTIAPSVTTTAEMSTTTTGAAEPTGFFIIAGEGPALGQKLQSSEDYGSIVSFNPTRSSRFQPRRFTVDDSTGILTNEGTPMCASFNAWDKNRAKVTPCIYENRAGGGSYITCDKSPSSGDVLHCTAIKLNCWQIGPGSSQACEEVEDPLWNNQFFIQRNTGVDSDNESTLLFGQDNLSETFTSPYSTIEKVDLFVNVAMISAPTP